MNYSFIIYYRLLPCFVNPFCKNKYFSSLSENFS
nr:MAG TPA: hypothetical protein [Bacteriophage sp.]